MTIEDIDSLCTEPNILRILGEDTVNLIADHADRVVILVDHLRLSRSAPSADLTIIGLLDRARAFIFLNTEHALHLVSAETSVAPAGAPPIFIVLAAYEETRLKERADATRVTRDIEETHTILRWVGKVRTVLDLI